MVEPQGTPFAYVRLDLPIDSQTFAQQLLARKRVLVMPSEVFADQQAVRISFGRPDDILAEALDRIAQEIRRYR